MNKPQLNFDAVFKELSDSKLSPKALREPRSPTLLEGVCVDTRKISPSHIFCAVKGSQVDTHDLVKSLTVQPGLILVEESPQRSLDYFQHPIEQFNHIGIIQVRSTRAAWAQLASLFAGHPSRSLQMIAVTGTNGKTSTVWMIRSLLEGLGLQAASIGTLGFIDNNAREESAHTTPDPDVLYPKLGSWLQQGITHVVMEVSSHSLVQGKVHPIQFAAAAFTSFSQDHLDFHPTMDDYLRAKIQLFDFHLAPRACALFHESVARLSQVRECRGRIAADAVVYGRTQGPSQDQEIALDYNVTSKSLFSLGMTRVIIADSKRHQISKFTISMVGDVFADNFAASLVLTSATTRLSIADIQTRLSSWVIPAVSGRLECVSAPLKPWRPLVYVDYAHTPDALEKAILNLSPHEKSIYTVFGCGGDRDRSKRPIMGELAARLSKSVCVTSDNPRSEDPLSICKEILVGIPSSSGNVSNFVDRGQAISVTIQSARGQDIILIAGKGHEHYQIIGKEKQHFSDQEKALEELDRQKTWLVFGSGVSGIAAANHLTRYNDIAIIADDNPIDLALLRSRGLDPNILSTTVENIPWHSLYGIVVSPGVPLTHTVIQAAKTNNVEVITETDLGLDRYQGSIIAVTGTNGKSTTVAMSEFLLKGLGVDAVACGNIGLSTSALNLRERSAAHAAVIELSSYQLEGCRKFAANGAAITSFSFDHIARHKTMDAYFDAKWKITQWLDEDSLFVVSLEVARYALGRRVKWPMCKTLIIGCGESTLAQEGISRDGLPRHVAYINLLRFNETARSHAVLATRAEIDFDELGIRGAHNQMNAVTASLLVAHHSKVDLETLLRALSAYKPLAYRSEVIFDDKKKCIVNDSKSTNLESTIAALSIAKRPAILLMGGQGKGEPYAGLVDHKDKIYKLLCFGASRHEIADGAKGLPNVEIFATMASAVGRALEISQAEGTDIIFSPGCASFDEFKNFEHRGKIFNDMVEAFYSKTTIG